MSSRRTFFSLLSARTASAWSCLVGLLRRQQLQRALGRHRGAARADGARAAKEESGARGSSEQHVVGSEGAPERVVSDAARSISSVIDSSLELARAMFARDRRGRNGWPRKQRTSSQDASISTYPYLLKYWRPTRPPTAGVVRVFVGGLKLSAVSWTAATVSRARAAARAPAPRRRRVAAQPPRRRPAAKRRRQRGRRAAARDGGDGRRRRHRSVGAPRAAVGRLERARARRRAAVARRERVAARAPPAAAAVRVAAAGARLGVRRRRAAAEAAAGGARAADAAIPDEGTRRQLGVQRRSRLLRAAAGGAAAGGALPTLSPGRPP